MNILVLTSKENFVWHSMQEIIPYIENIWKHANSDKYQIKIIDVDHASLGEITKEAMAASHIVLTCFNLKICKIATFLRFNLKLSIGFIIYVHNMATIAFWPFRKYGNEQFFKANDIFVTSCINDKKTLSAVFNNPKTILSPFFFNTLDINYLNKKVNSELKCVYVGRISSQKNIKNLISAFAILKKTQKIPKFYLFGKEDGLGSPNMGVSDSNYQEELQSLVNELNLNDDIIFMGHQPRDLINLFLSQNNCLSVSASLHSDENFGMAILQSLVLGNNSLISNWGGHTDFKEFFGSRVHLIPINQTTHGPSLEANQIAKSLATAMSITKTEDVSLNSYYTLESQISKIHEALITTYSSQELDFTELANEIYQQKKVKFEKHPTQIFTGHTDPLFLKISKFYIGD